MPPSGPGTPLQRVAATRGPLAPVFMKRGGSIEEERQHRAEDHRSVGIQRKSTANVYNEPVSRRWSSHRWGLARPWRRTRVGRPGPGRSCPAESLLWGHTPGRYGQRGHSQELFR